MAPVDDVVGTVASAAAKHPRAASVRGIPSRDRHRFVARGAVAGLYGGPGGQQKQEQCRHGPYPIGQRPQDSPQPLAQPERVPDGGRIAAVGLRRVSSNSVHLIVHREYLFGPAKRGIRLQSVSDACRLTVTAPKNGHGRTHPAQFG